MTHRRTRRAVAEDDLCPVCETVIGLCREFWRMPWSGRAVHEECEQIDVEEAGAIERMAVADEERKARWCEALGRGMARAINSDIASALNINGNHPKAK